MKEQIEKIKKGMEVILKVSVYMDRDKKLCIDTFPNKQIPLKLQIAIDKGLHQVIEKENHSAEWKKEYIYFRHEGKQYRQIDGCHCENESCCKGCVFRRTDYQYNTDPGFCKHPYFMTKGDCDGKIYIDITDTVEK